MIEQERKHPVGVGAKGAHVAETVTGLDPAPTGIRQGSGESWDAVFENVRTHVVAVKARVAPNEPFGVGLRLSARAAATLLEPARLEAFKDFLVSHQLYVFTINGFPYGQFHGVPVKEQVYRPDWLEPERERLRQLRLHALETRARRSLDEDRPGAL